MDRSGHSEVYSFVALNNRPDEGGAILPVTDLHFRVATIQPGLVNDPIRCDLKTTTIGKHQDDIYEALSYCWGSLDERESILLDSRSFNVTKNLYSALLHLRHPTHTRTVFIDAICINQNDIAERNILVRNMWAIYKYAREVVVFLGPEAKHTQKVFDRIQELGEWLRKESSFSNAPSPPDSEWPHLWEGVKDIFDRAWWRRVWIIQEIAVATDVRVMCGSHELPWICFDAIISMRVGQLVEPQKFDRILAWPYDRYDAECKTSRAGISWDSAAAIQVARNSYLKQHECSTNLNTALDRGLGTYLIRFREFGCQDPRDKVYGIMKLSQSSDDIIPDYSETNTVIDVFMDAVKSSLRGGLGIFSALDYTEFEQYIASGRQRPSWCPNFNAPGPENYPFFQIGFDCSRGTEVTFRFDESTMVLEGYELDTLDMFPTCSPYAQDITFSTERHDLIRDWSRCVGERQASCTPYKYHEARCAALDRTISLLTEKYFEEEFQRLQNFGSGYGCIPFKLSELHGQETQAKTDAIEPIYIGNYVQAKLQKAIRRDSSLTDENKMVPPHRHGRRFFISKQGYIGLVPLAAQQGDVLVILRGGKVPFCLRPLADTANSFHIVGDCYVDGVMYGEAMDSTGGHEVRERSFYIV